MKMSRLMRSSENVEKGLGQPTCCECAGRALAELTGGDHCRQTKVTVSIVGSSAQSGAQLRTD